MVIFIHIYFIIATAMRHKTGSWLTLWDAIVCANDLPCAELLFRRQSELLGKYPEKPNKILPSDIIGEAMNLCCALGHTKLLEFFLGELAVKSQKVPNTFCHLLAPPFAILPFWFKNELFKPMLYVIAFNQHELLKSLLSRMKMQIYEQDPMAAWGRAESVDISGKGNQQAKLSTSPFFVLSPGNSDVESSFGQRTFSIEINNFMLLEMLDNCAVYGAYECAQLILEKFHSVIPSVLCIRKHDIYFRDFSCFAINHGVRMMALFEPFAYCSLPHLNFEMMDLMFEGVALSICPKAFAEGINFLTSSLESELHLGENYKRSLSKARDIHSLTGNSNFLTSLTMPRFLYRLISPCYMMFATLFPNEKMTGPNKVMSVKDAHLQIPHWRALHGCSCEPREYPKGSGAWRQHEQIFNHLSSLSGGGEKENEEEDLIECQNLESLLPAMQLLFDFEIRNPEIYLLGRTSDGQTLRIPPLSLCFCRCFLNAFTTLKRITGNIPSSRLSALSQLLRFLADNLKKFPVSIRNTLYAVLVGTRGTNALDGDDIILGDSKRPLEILAEKIAVAEVGYITEPSFKKLMQTLAQIHSAYWRSDYANAGKTSTFWIIEMQMQKVCTGQSDPFSVLAPFVHLECISRVSMGRMRHLISDIFLPCLEAFTPINVIDPSGMQSFVVAWRRNCVKVCKAQERTGLSFILFQMSRRTLLACTRPNSVALLVKLAAPFVDADELGSLYLSEVEEMADLNSEDGSDNSPAIPSLGWWHSTLSNIWRAFLRANKIGTLRDIYKSSFSRTPYAKMIEKKPVKRLVYSKRFQNSSEESNEDAEPSDSYKESIFQLRELARQAIWAAVLSSRCAVKGSLENVSLRDLLASIPLPALLVRYIAFE